MRPLAAHLLPRIVVALVALTICLAALELGLRTWSPAGPGVWRGLDPGNPEAPCVEPSWSRGWRPKRDACGRDGAGLLRASAGEGQAHRVVVLGDSIAQQHTWVEAMTTSLAARPEVGAVDTFNAGSSGYDPCRAARAWVEDAAAVEPDLVVWQLGANDLWGSPVLAPLDGGRARYHLGDGRAFDLPAWMLHSHLLTHLTLRLGATSAPRVVEEAPGARVATTARCLENLARELAETRGGVPLVVVVFPVLVDSDSVPEGRAARELEHERELVALLGSLELDPFELRPPLEALGPLEGMRYTSDDSLHPHVRVHGAIGELVAAEVAARLP